MSARAARGLGSQSKIAPQEERGERVGDSAVHSPLPRTPFGEARRGSMGRGGRGAAHVPDMSMEAKEMNVKKKLFFKNA